MTFGKKPAKITKSKKNAHEMPVKKTTKYHDPNHQENGTTTGFNPDMQINRFKGSLIEKVKQA
jgi:Ni,Fe-hydrogenase maturation factor